MLRNVKYMSETLKNRLELLILKGKIFSNDSMLFTVKKKSPIFRLRKNDFLPQLDMTGHLFGGTSVNFSESLFTLF